MVLVHLLLLHHASNAHARVSLLCLLCQVIKHDGSRGLVPKSYVQVAEDEEDDSDALSLAGRSSISGAQTQADGAADYSSFLARWVAGDPTVCVSGAVQYFLLS